MRERDAFALHLFPDAVEVLGPALHFGAHAVAAQLVAQAPAKTLDAALALDARLVEHAGDRLVLLGLQEAKRQVLDLPLDLPDAEAIGERREDLHRLARQHLRAGLLAGRVVAQRLQTRREAQQHHAQVAREREQHLAHALGLQRALVFADLRLACDAPKALATTSSGLLK